MHLNIDSVLRQHIWTVARVFYCILKGLSATQVKFENSSIVDGARKEFLKKAKQNAVWLFNSMDVLKINKMKNVK